MYNHLPNLILVYSCASDSRYQIFARDTKFMPSFVLTTIYVSKSFRYYLAWNSTTEITGLLRNIVLSSHFPSAKVMLPHFHKFLVYTVLMVEDHPQALKL